MLVTRDTVNNMNFENEDARLLVLDTVNHTNAQIYYWDADIEITVFIALKIREKAYKAEERGETYRLSLLDPKHIPFRRPARRSRRLSCLMHNLSD